MKDSNLIVDVLIRMATKADSLSHLDSLYQNMFREIMRFGNLHGILPEKKRRPVIIKFYEAIKNLRHTSRNSHFWLQYAIARLSFPDLEKAKIYFDTAYSFARAARNYNTNQIDNHYARYLLEKAKEVNKLDVAMELFKEAHELLVKQVLREKVHHPYRVASNYYNFYLQYCNEMNSNDKNILLKNCQAILSRIERLAPVARTNQYVTDCERKLKEIIRRQNP